MADKKLQRRTLALEVRAVTDEVDENGDPVEGIIEGYASKYGEVDSYGSVMDPGCFTNTIRGRVKKIKLFYQHNWNVPAGVWLDIQEDSNGLKVKGQLALNTQLGRETWELIKLGALDGFSIGFYPIQEEINRETQVIHYKEVKLVETSVVVFPACDSARITDVRTIADEINNDLLDLGNEQLIRVRSYIQTLKSSPDVAQEPPIAEASAEKHSEETQADTEQSEDPQTPSHVLQSLEQLRQAFKQQI